MKPIEIAPGIYDVGVNDWNISDFHGYSTPFGTSYNAYLVLDEKIALIDTVKSGFADELLYNISKVVDPKKIDLVISNHTEMDHSGSLARVMHRIGEDKPLYCSKMGEKKSAAALSPQAELSACGQRAGAHHRSTYVYLLGNPNGALARQHVHLPEGGQDSVFQRRVRAALRRTREV